MLRTPLSKVSILVAGCAVALGVAALQCTSGSPRPQPQHVLLIVIDTLRADHLGIFGYPRPTSPVLDQLAKQGALFDNAISQASFTSPSMVSLMTGHYIAKERLDIPSELGTLAESFQKAGWATGAFVSNPLINSDNGFARGFDRFEHLDEYGSNDKVAQWFGESKGRKTFTYIHITEPHDPYTPPESQRPFRAKKDLLPGDREQFYAEITGAMKLADSPGQTEHIKEEIGGYDDDVLYADTRVGEFLDELDAAGLRATTAIAVTADHGEGLWEHVALMNGQRGTKLQKGEAPSLTNALMPTHGNQVHRELVHVPLMLSANGIAAGRTVHEPVENLDLFPTLLELAEVSAPRGLQGTSLLRRLDGSKVSKNESFSFTRFNSTIVTADGMQLILPTEEGICAEQLVPELFDLTTDPYQRHNLAQDRPDVVGRLTEVAAKRMKNAIHADGGPATPATIDVLKGLGYIDIADRENARAELASMPLSEVVTKLATFNTPCVTRLLAAESLADRTLDDDARAKLREWRAKETSTAVQRALDKLLGQ